MKPTWHFITGAPQKMWALYKSEKPTCHKMDSWGSDLMGFIEKAKDGSWDCFAPQLIGNQPNKEHAALMVQKFCGVSTDQGL